MALKSELVEQLLELSPTDRADLARQLLLSLEPTDVDADADQAWEAEIERRCAAVDRGEVELLDWRTSVERIRNTLRGASGK
jgi:putative addiction module component (TIGR02574 family)